MKLLNIVTFVVCTLGSLSFVSAEARDYEITYYGCDLKCLPYTKSEKNRISGCSDKECHSTDGPSCYASEKDAFGNGKNSYFSAIVNIKIFF